jgi:hypothetical protein
MSVCVPDVAAVKNSAELCIFAIIQALPASVLDAPLNCSFHFLLAKFPLNRATWPMCPVMLVVRPYIVKTKVSILAIICIAAVVVAYVLPNRKGHEVNIDVPGLGQFQGEYFESDGKLYCYSLKRQFKGRTVDVIIYPKDNGKDYKDDDKEEVIRRYELYVEKFDSAVAASIKLIRDKCKDYGNDLVMTDTEIIQQIKVDNIKIEGEGEYESYCNAGRIDENHDLVLRFNSSMILIEVGFDG